MKFCAKNSHHGQIVLTWNNNAMKKIEDINMIMNKDYALV